MNAHTIDPRSVLKCQDTADFLAALPRLIGYTATDSIFLVLFAGRRTDRALRIDLPDDEHPERTVALLDFICDAVRGFSDGQPDRPAVVISCRRTFAESQGAPWRRLAKRIERRLRREGFPPRELCCIAPDGWVGYSDTDAPRLGRPLAEIDASPISQQTAGLGEIPDVSQLGAVPPAEPRRARAVASALEALPRYTRPSVDPAAAEDARRRLTDRAFDVESRSDAAGEPWSTGDFAWIEETVTVGRAMLASLSDDSSTQPSIPPGKASGSGTVAARLTPRMTARLLRTTEHSDRWLVLAMGLITRPEFPFELALESGPEHLASLPLESEVIEREGRTALVTGSMHRFLASICHEFTEHRRAQSLCRMLLHAIAEAPRELRPGILALSAWLWWMGGGQTVAERHLREALDIDPEHGLSLMVRKLVAHPACIGHEHGYDDARAMLPERSA